MFLIIPSWCPTRSRDWFNVRSVVRLAAFGMLVVFPSTDPCAAQATGRATVNKIDGLVVTVVDEATIVSTVQGPIASISVIEGQTVRADDEIAQIDDRQIQIQCSLARKELVIAESAVTQTHTIQAAQCDVGVQQSRLDQHEVETRMNRKRSESGLKVAAAEKSEAVAENELKRSESSRQNFAGSVSDSEIESLRLTFQRCELETRQARLEQELAGLQVELDDATGDAFAGQLDAARIRLREAESNQTTLAIEAEIKRLRFQLAEAAVDQRRLKTTIAGTVVQVSARSGDWVDPGDVIARVVSTVRLRVDGYAVAQWADRLQGGRSVSIVVQTPDGPSMTFAPTRRFVSPEVDPVTGEIRFWIEFENSAGGAKPGYSATLLLASP